MEPAACHSLYLEYAAPMVDDALLRFTVEYCCAGDGRDLGVGRHVRRRLEAAARTGGARELLNRGLTFLAHQPVDDHPPRIGMRRFGRNERDDREVGDA